jgi:HEAT repeat protein/beta-lactamase regulating signal transducer with metallopeptidase domain
MESSFGFPLLLDGAVKGTLVLLAATVLVLLLRQGSAASRHLVWQLAVLAILGLPVIKVLSPLRLPVLPELRSPIVRNDAAHLPAQSVVPSDVAAAAPSAAQDPQRGEPKSTVIDATSSNAATSPNAETSSTPKTPFTLRLFTWIGLAWLVIATGLLLRLALGFVLVRWFALRAYPLYENGWSELKDELSGLVGLRHSVQLYASPHVATPMTWGIVHPVIMFPAAAEDWSLERRRVVMLHELAHIQRKDSLTHMVAQIACAVYWFHPLVWKAAARMRAEAERACDDLVLRAGTKASVYADHLLELIRTIGGMRTPALALPMAQRSTFEGRLLAILEPHLDRTTPRPWSVWGMIAVAGLILFPLAGLTTASGIVTEAERVADASGKQIGAPLGSQLTQDVAQSDLSEAPKSKALDNFTESIADLTVETSVSVLSELTTQYGKGSGSSTSTSTSTQQRAASLAVGPLMRALSDANVDVRLAAAQSLGQIEDSVAVAALSNALRNDTDARVRKMAAWALGQIEDGQAVPALTHALKNDRAVEVRRTAVWALGQIEEASAVSALSDAIADSDAEVRSLAVWALGQIEDDHAVPALVNVLKSGDVEMRRQAAWALGQIEDEKAVPGLAAALRDSDAKVREQAVWALGQIESPQAVAPLSALASDASVETRKQVAWAFGQIEDAGAVPPLSGMLRDDKSVEVRKTAAWALGQIESAAALPALSAALKDASSEVRKQAAWALGQIESRPAPQALLDALKDNDSEVRATAAWALSQIEDPNSANALRGALGDVEPTVRQAVLNALVSLGDQIGYEALAEMLKDADPAVRRAAAAAMGGRRSGWPDPQPQPQPKPQPRPKPQPLQ